MAVCKSDNSEYITPTDTAPLSLQKHMRTAPHIKLVCQCKDTAHVGVDTSYQVVYYKSSIQPVHEPTD